VIGSIAAWTGRDNDGWRAMAQVAPRSEPTILAPDAMPPAVVAMGGVEMEGHQNDAPRNEGFAPPQMQLRKANDVPRVAAFVAPAPKFAPPGIAGAQRMAPGIAPVERMVPGRARMMKDPAPGAKAFDMRLENAQGFGGEEAPQLGGRLAHQRQFPAMANERFTEFFQRRNAGLVEGKLFQNQEAIGLMMSMVPQVPALIVREYAHTREVNPNDDDATRTDFTETLLWQPVLVIPKLGKMTVEFTLSDAINPYRVLVAGHTLDGRIGAITGTLEVRKPFSLDPKLPIEISSADKLDVVLLGANNTDTALTGQVTVTPKGLKSVGSEQVAVELPANGGGRKIVRLTPTLLDGPLSLKLDGKAGAYRDSVERTFSVVADGFPAAGSHSDVLETSVGTKLKFAEQLVPGTLQFRVAVYPNTLSEVQSGLEGLLREPSGCFEQTSTSNYPNVLVLDYLTETNQAKPEVSKRAKDLLDRGYAKLTSFECAKPGESGRQGYEWFGGSAPPHEALTAYGLLQFTDMARVHPVDAAMVKRTKEYLMTRRDGKGGFEKNARAIDSFGYATVEITNAYIVWAITEADRKEAAQTDLAKEIDAISTLAKTDARWGKDSYYLGLVANSLLNRGKKADGVALLKVLAKAQAKDGSVPGAETSITKSSGQALVIETTALAMLGWLKANDTGEFRAQLDASSKWLGSQKGGAGAFGSTQSTILTLKALIEYARTQKRATESGELRVVINGGVVAKKSFTTDNVGPIVLEIPDAETYVGKGDLDIRLETDAKQSYPCTFSWDARSRKPQSSAECPLTLTTTLNKVEASEGDTLRLTAKVVNTADKEQGMVTAIIGIPAGLKIPEDLKQLKALTERPMGGREQVSYFEIRGRELILYWRGMAPKQAVDLSIDLIADFPGEYRAPASRIYLYYGAEHKMWVDPVSVKVTAK
jgi:alpha-2-macroglobulin-like protein